MIKIFHKVFHFLCVFFEGAINLEVFGIQSTVTKIPYYIQDLE